MSIAEHYKYYFSAFSYLGLLSAGYVWLVSPLFAYSGLVYSLSLSNLFTGLVAFIAFLLFMPKSLKSPSDFYINLLFYIVYTPLMLLYAFAGQDSSTFWSISSGVALILFVCSYKYHK